LKQASTLAGAAMQQFGMHQVALVYQLGTDLNPVITSPALEIFSARVYQPKRYFTSPMEGKQLSQRQ
jgi:hypothetical protein